MDKIAIWLYWSGSQDNRTFDLTGFPATGGWVYLPISSWGKQALDITDFAIGYDIKTETNWTVYIDNIMFIKDIDDLPVIEPAGPEAIVYDEN